MTVSAPDRVTTTVSTDTARRVPWLFILTTGAALLVAAGIIAAAIVMDDGHLVYLTDDPGIHLSIVNNLVHHGTWGVTPGVFESASSSPGWTLLLAGLTVVIPPFANVWPLIANLVAGVWLVWIFTTNQRLIDARDRSWSTWLLAVALGVVVLYIPALALLGMEHTLQCALVLYAFVLLERLQRKPLTLRAIAPLLGITFLASLVRFETMFVAIGFAIALIVGTLAHLGSDDTKSNWTLPTALRAGVLVGLASVAPVVGLGLVNWSFGRSFLPNSILSKSKAASDPGLGKLFENPADLMNDLLRDPLLVACALLVAILLIWAWCGGSRRNVVLSTAFLIAVLLHGHFADLGWYERYQTYLVVIGVYIAFQVLADFTPTQLRTAAKLTLVLGIVVLSFLRIDLTVSAPRASSNTYRQRYQMGRFFEREYAHQAVATTELGYPSLFHDGPMVDLLGLGSHEVLDTIRGPGLNNARVAQIFNDNNVRVFGILSEYPLRPAGWKQVGLWFLDERLVPGPYGRILEFWAPPGHVAELRRKLKEFEPSLPDRVVVVYPKQAAADS